MGYFWLLSVQVPFDFIRCISDFWRPCISMHYSLPMRAMLASCMPSSNDLIYGCVTGLLDSNIKFRPHGNDYILHTTIQWPYYTCEQWPQCTHLYIITATYHRANVYAQGCTVCFWYWTKMVLKYLGHSTITWHLLVNCTNTTMQAQNIIGVVLWLILASLFFFGISNVLRIPGGANLCNIFETFKTRFEY